MAELCSQLLTKGRKVYVEGRLQTRSWETPDGVTKQITEVVIDDMRILDSRREAYGEEYQGPPATGSSELPAGGVETKAVEDKKATKATVKTKKEEANNGESAKSTEDKEIDLEDLPF